MKRKNAYIVNKHSKYKKTINICIGARIATED
jgi:hypothetical protein